MRRFGIKRSIGFLVGLMSVATFMAAPAWALHRHHHHHAAAGPVCGPGTVDIGGLCTPTGSPGPVGNSNVNIMPNSVTMELDGTFASSAAVSGLPPLTTVNSAAVACGPAPNTIVTVPQVGIAVDALGRAQVNIVTNGLRGGPGSCIPGTYPITFTETVSPFQSFTGFITLHF